MPTPASKKESAVVLVARLTDENLELKRQLREANGRIVEQDAIFTRQRETYRTAANAVRTVSDYVNNMGHDPKEFVDLFQREHRTLQQSFTKVVLLWLWTLTQLSEHHYDLRNEAAVKTAKRLMANEDEYVWRLPCI